MNALWSVGIRPKNGMSNPLEELARDRGVDWVLNDSIVSLLDFLRKYPGWDGTVQFRAVEHALELWRKGDALP